MPLNADQLALVKTTILRPKNREATDDELKLFAYQCERTGLDPFTKQIYGIYRYDGRQKREVMQVQVSVDGLRLIAERTGHYLGQTPAFWCGEDALWCEVWLSSEPPSAAKVGVYKRDNPHPTYAVARLASYAQAYDDGNLKGLWRTMPEVMIAKVAESLALRKAFPAETSGIHTTEELAPSLEGPEEVTAELEPPPTYELPQAEPPPPVLDENEAQQQRALIFERHAELEGIDASIVPAEKLRSWLEVAMGDREPNSRLDDLTRYLDELLEHAKRGLVEEEPVVEE